MKKHISFKIFNFIFFAVVITICLFPFLFTNYSIYPINTKEGIGSTIGGIMGPFIAILAAYLTFMAFWVQFRFNENQKNDLTRERFENSFYKLMDIYHDKIRNINIGNTVTGQPSFRYIFYELKDVLRRTQNTFSITEYDKLYLYIGYEIFMSGVIEDRSVYKLNKRIKDNYEKHLMEQEKSKGRAINNLNKTTYIYIEKLLQDIEYELVFVNKNFKSRNYCQTKGLYWQIFPKGVNLYYGHLPQLKPYLNHVYFMINYLDAYEKEYKKYADSDPIKKTIANCKEIFLSQLTYHEMGIISICANAEYLDLFNGDPQIKPNTIEDINKRMTKYAATFLWTSPDFFEDTD